ncbi:MAG: DUF4317 domain-containing protein [Oscillospiraceae bacterium]|nr:DUF4317 domain-containing protein [Oscillospiraceae bacterium]
MNKKELGEIKKNFTAESGLFTVNKVLYAFIDGEKRIACSEVRSFVTMAEDECSVVMETLKKALSGSLGKNLTEYAFPNESYDDDGAQNILYRTLKGGLDDEEANSVFVSRIAENAAIGTAYTIITGFCSYTVLKKDKNDEKLDDADTDYNFLITAICPANTGDDGLFYDRERGGIYKKSNTEMIISRAPQDGILFPVFSGRSADVNSVMYYTRSPKKPNLSIVEDVLDCTFSYTAEGEKERFRAVLSNVCGDELDYTVITQVNDIIEDVIAQNKNETEPTLIDSPRLRNILADAGISDDKLTAVEDVYSKIVGEFPLKATNLVETKTVLSAEAITVNIGRDAVDKVHTSVIQGRKCLIIDLDDNLTINGMDTTVETATSEV